jgi:23S rRNA (pseudouridine1915-N3)-methyltransferase
MIEIVAVGKLNADYFREAFNDYIKRLNPYIRVNVTEIPESRPMGENEGDIKRVIESEGAAILSKIKGYVYALDSRGAEQTSEQFAETIRMKLTEGTSEITFVIGGSYGLSDEIKKRGTLLSFGRFTYPHQLMRVILAEQLYRAFSIINNSKYHK